MSADTTRATGCPARRGDPGPVSWTGLHSWLQRGGALAYLFGFHRRSAAVPTVIVAESSVVDGITVIVSHEGLYMRREAGRKGGLVSMLE